MKQSNDVPTAPRIRPLLNAREVTLPPGSRRSALAGWMYEAGYVLIGVDTDPDTLVELREHWAKAKNQDGC